ncbi:hypothetical protein QCA50_001873 [Cerrena zonata]|uniref:Metallothionein n=1 Tax=Cerrena zonata TaxID=2478898 RepID=A0AAW0GU56_9APHY
MSDTQQHQNEETTPVTSSQDSDSEHSGSTTPSDESPQDETVTPTLLALPPGFRPRGRGNVVTSTTTCSNKKCSCKSCSCGPTCSC